MFDEIYFQSKILNFVISLQPIIQSHLGLKSSVNKLK